MIRLHRLLSGRIRQNARRLRFERLEIRLPLSASPAPELAPWLFVPSTSYEQLIDAKLGQVLTALHVDWLAHDSLTESQTQSFSDYRASQSRVDILPIVDDTVALDIVTFDDAVNAQESLAAIGFEEIATIGRISSGWLPITSLDELVQLSNVNFASAASSFYVNQGATATQGDLIQLTERARSQFALNGNGITVGAISLSYDKVSGLLTTAADDIASGDLPGPTNPNGFTNPVDVLYDDRTALDINDEGRAMLQIVHDIAPGSSLAFASEGNASPPFLFETQFANRIRELADDQDGPDANLVAADCDVIVDDIVVTKAPMFQDGLIAQAIDEVVTNDGVVYVTSAGNGARRSYESTFNPGVPITTLAGRQETPHLVDAATGNYRQRLTLGDGEYMTLSVQWDEPFFSLGGAGSANDINVYLYKANSNVMVRFFNTNNLTKDPFELFDFTNQVTQTNTTEFDLVITNGAGPNPGRFKYVAVQGTAVFDDATFTRSSSTFGHANAAGAITVGASDYRTPSSLESYSSAGGTPILFDTQGNRLAQSIVRAKPDIVGPDKANTTFFETIAGDPEGDGFPNFAGTSASAPHVAGLVALILEANPNLTPAEVKEILTSTAIDMDDPHSPEFDYGFDHGTGHGFVDGMQAITKVLADALPPKVMDVIVSSTVSDHDPFELSRASNVGVVEQPQGMPAVFKGTGAQLGTVPVGNINAIDVVFSKLADVDINDLIVTGLATATLPTAYGFTAPTAGNNFTARWTFDDPATTSVVETISVQDYYLLTLNSASITAAGVALDGEWVNPKQRFVNPSDPTAAPSSLAPYLHESISRFPSGNGTAGGDFNFVISVVPADADLDLFVGTGDFNIIFNNFFINYTQFVDGDLNGDGQVGTEDFNLVFNSFFTGLGPVRLAGDVNGDNVVDSLDMAAINANQGLTNATRQQGDANGDGVVNMADSDLANAQLGRTFEFS